MKEVKCLLAKVAIIQHDKDPYDLYTPAQVFDLNLISDNYHGCRFIEIGHVITIADKKYKVKNMAFRLDPLEANTNSYTVDAYDEDHEFSNCQISVIVEPV